ncbi:MAG: site-2 protease family protein [Candidatus Kapabacteria bacterium]|jgi:membrane-associated protease RseP (regulator of RpoE activity)|nr:site-2 protease family protein [Candidatus Kapabacteria bacterium]
MGFTPMTVHQRRSRPLVHILLFLATLFSTAMAGAWFAERNPLELTNLGYGLHYAILLLLFLATHEFGHYVAARWHGVDASLPYFIPVPFPELTMFGTMGAVIRMRSRIPDRKALFDIGVAGPLAGFVVCVVFLIIGFRTLPPFEYLTSIHPHITHPAELTSSGLTFGTTILYSVLAATVAPDGAFVPPMNEMYHYPFLCVGWFGLFVTALNMLPFGQLDGGHILYALVGRQQRRIARFLWWILFAMGFSSVANMARVLLASPSPESWVIFLQGTLLPVLESMHAIAPWLFAGNGSWLVWALVIRILVKVDHPDVPEVEPLSPLRKVLGWFSFIVLIGSFSLSPVSLNP